ncbi:MAG: hypothetical protein P0Y65_06755 [Candidatus Devosia phytovorans]|uniref:Uncharacterized protein n=1 Tax=Candidatus Devosia phytovorans TaxID=3121372 RepID=A0AAJ6B2Z3_9HYPH|nr:hypothetical protein [Devosia sp.]WEK05948.1 MAG: hypothetical protein P0Y65_06755 [Devosia sp.]
MRQVFSLVLASTALALLAGPSLAKDKAEGLDLTPLLDGFVQGCDFSEPLYDLIASLRPTTRDGGTLAVPEGYADVVGEPTHEGDGEGAQIYHLPLPGQWHGQPVVGIDFVNQDDAGMFVAAVRFVGDESAVTAQFDPLVEQSQAMLDEEEMSVDFGHVVLLDNDQGVMRLICNLST